MSLLTRVVNGKKVKITDSFKPMTHQRIQSEDTAEFLKANSATGTSSVLVLRMKTHNYQPCKAQDMRLTPCTRRSSRTL